MTLYLLDASTLINAHRTWYGLNRVPEFWQWLLFHAEGGRVKIPAEIYTEVENGTDELSTWMKDADHKIALRLQEQTNLDAVQTVLKAYAGSLSEDDLIKIGQDPFLVAAALGHSDRCVVTAENHSPKKQGANRKIPNICEDCDVHWRSSIDFISELNFTTNWSER